MSGAGPERSLVSLEAGEDAVAAAPGGAAPPASFVRVTFGEEVERAQPISTRRSRLFCCRAPGGRVGAALVPPENVIYRLGSSAGCSEGAAEKNEDDNWSRREVRGRSTVVTKPLAHDVHAKSAGVKAAATAGDLTIAAVDGERFT